MAVAQGTKPAKKAAAPKKTKTSPSHPLYIEMIKEALVSLKERTGSSAIAIAKHIEEQQKVRDLPPNFRKRLAVQLKKFVASGKLIKVKNSFKLPSSSSTTAAKKSPSAATTDSKPKPKSTQTALKKKKATATSKPKAAKVAKSPVKKAAAKRVAKSPVKKVAAVKAKKVKSIKSPVKKAPVAKKAKK